MAKIQIGNFFFLIWGTLTFDEMSVFFGIFCSPSWSFAEKYQFGSRETKVMMLYLLCCMCSRNYLSMVEAYFPNDLINVRLHQITIWILAQDYSSEFSNILLRICGHMLQFTVLEGWGAFELSFLDWERLFLLQLCRGSQKICSCLSNSNSDPTTLSPCFFKSKKIIPLFSVTWQK